MQSTTRIKTEKASSYLRQLCKHFAHKCETQFDAAQGTVQFPMAHAAMTAQGDTLDIAITADNPEGLERGRNVIWSHLERFAFREDLPAPEWSPTA